MRTAERLDGLMYRVHWPNSLSDLRQRNGISILLVQKLFEKYLTV